MNNFKVENLHVNKVHILCEVTDRKDIIKVKTPYISLDITEQDYMSLMYEVMNIIRAFRKFPFPNKKRKAARITM